MKKTTLMALILSVGVLTACGGSKKSESAVDASKNAANTTDTSVNTTQKNTDTAADANKKAAETTVNKAAEVVRTAKPE